ncbi:unnamed protein product [Sphagnum balticum]
MGAAEVKIGAVVEEIAAVERKIATVLEEVEVVKGQIAAVVEQVHVVEGQFAVLKNRSPDLTGISRQPQDTDIAERELGTESDWLCQNILVMDPSTSSSSHKYPSNWDQERIWKPQRIKEWDLLQEIEDYAKGADRKKQAFEMLVTKIVELQQDQPACGAELQHHQIVELQPHQLLVSLDPI